MDAEEGKLAFKVGIMDQFTGQQLEILLSMTVLVHCAMGLLLFGLARMADRSTLLWSVIGLVSGLLGLLAYIAVSVFEMANPAKRGPAFTGDDYELAAHLISQTDMRGDNDNALDELIRDGYLDKARQQAREKMQQAFNYNDTMRERIYRGYIQRIDDMITQPLEIRG